VLADFLGFVGSIAFGWSALRFSNYLLSINRIETVLVKYDKQHPVAGSEATGNDNTDDKAVKENQEIGRELVEIMKGHGSCWNRRDHVIMIFGLSCICLSFLVSFVEKF